MTQERDPHAGLARLIATQAIAAKKLLLVTRDTKEYTMNGKAENAKGAAVSPLSKEAVKWSLLGSIYRARLSQEEAMAVKLMFEMPNFPIESISFGIRWSEMRKILKEFAKDAGKKRQLYEDYCKLASKLVASKDQKATGGDVNGAEAERERGAGSDLDSRVQDPT